MLFDENENDESDAIPTNQLCVPAQAISDEDLLLREQMHRYRSGAIPVAFVDDDPDGRELLANAEKFTVLAAELGRPPTLAEAMAWIKAERSRIDAEFAEAFAIVQQSASGQRAKLTRSAGSHGAGAG
jgi:hypothetical protein